MTAPRYWALPYGRTAWEEISGAIYTDLVQSPGTVSSSLRTRGPPPIESAGTACCDTMDATVRPPDSSSPRGAAHERLAVLTALEAVLPTVLPEATERSLLALVRQAQIRAFRRHERVLSQSRDPLLTFVVDGHLGAVRSDAGGRQQMITIAGPPIGESGNAGRGPRRGRGLAWP